MITAEQLAKVAHISDVEVWQDITDTEEEIRVLRHEIWDAEHRIADRQKFIRHLRAILATRHGTAESEDA